MKTSVNKEQPSAQVETWFVIEVCERELISVVQLATQKEAIQRANELLEAHAASICYEEEFAELMEELSCDPDADKGSCEVNVAREGREGAWCNWHDINWDAFVVQIDTIPEQTIITRAPTENY